MFASLAAELVKTFSTVSGLMLYLCFFTDHCCIILYSNTTLSRSSSMSCKLLVNLYRQNSHTKFAPNWGTATIPGLYRRRVCQKTLTVIKQEVVLGVENLLVLKYNTFPTKTNQTYRLQGDSVTDTACSVCLIFISSGTVYFSRRGVRQCKIFPIYLSNRILPSKETFE